MAISHNNSFPLKTYRTNLVRPLTQSFPKRVQNISHKSFNSFTYTPLQSFLKMSTRFPCFYSSFFHLFYDVFLFFCHFSYFLCCCFLLLFLFNSQQRLRYSALPTCRTSSSKPISKYLLRSCHIFDCRIR